MGSRIRIAMARAAWELARRQHWVIARWQLLELEFHRKAIEHRVAAGRLHSIHRGVYAVGRRALTQEGLWMAAVLACGQAAVLSHESAAQLLGILDLRPGPIHVSLPAHSGRRRPGIAIHNPRRLARHEIGHCRNIPVTSPIRTLIDLAAVLPLGELEDAVNRADKRDLVDPEGLRAALEGTPPRPGVAKLRRLLDRKTFRLTDSELERRFLRIVRETGLPLPETQVDVQGFRVDFRWPGLGLVVETDGLRYHRTAAQQAKDRHRDQVLTAAGLTCLRFSHADVRYERERVGEILVATANRLGGQVV